MRIPLNQFERIVNDTILKRGLNYYRNRRVTDVSKLSDIGYQASVTGTEKYIVRLKIGCNTLEEGLAVAPTMKVWFVNILLPQFFI